MDKKVLLLVGVMGGAAIFAATRTREQRPDIVPAPAEEVPVAPTGELPPGHPKTADLPPGHPPTADLPPGHPPTAASAGPQMQLPKGEAALVWTVPPSWQAVPHPSTMRLVTYRVPRAAGDAEDGELAVTVAGGDLEQNIARWIGQFDEPSRPSAKRSEKTVGALKVHVVEMAGNMTSMQGELQKDRAMIGAIVETPRGAHFFKLTGPKKTVLAARPDVDALLGSLKAK